MERYQSFFDININHQYFADQRCKSLAFVATDNSIKKMNNAGLMFRPNQSGLSVQADQNNAEILMLFAKDIHDPFEVQFKAYCTDANFINYTQPNIISEQGIFYFQQIFEGRGQIKKVNLHEDEWVTEKNVSPTSLLKEKGLITNRDKINSPCFIVSITITEQAIKDFINAEFIAPAYQVNFQTPTNIWKYYLMCDEDNHQVAVIDTNDETSFESMGVEHLGQNKKAVIFQSKTVLSLFEKSNYHFQLISTADNFSKVLIKRLPVAKVNQGYQKVVDGKAVPLSEIYINF